MGERARQTDLQAVGFVGEQTRPGAGPLHLTAQGGQVAGELVHFPGDPAAVGALFVAQFGPGDQTVHLLLDATEVGHARPPRA